MLPDQKLLETEQIILRAKRRKGPERGDDWGVPASGCLFHVFELQRKTRPENGFDTLERVLLEGAVKAEYGHEFRIWGEQRPSLDGLVYLLYFTPPMKGGGCYKKVLQFLDPWVSVKDPRSRCLMPAAESDGLFPVWRVLSGNRFYRYWRRDGAVPDFSGHTTPRPDSRARFIACDRSPEESVMSLQIAGTRVIVENRFFAVKTIFS